MRRQLSWVVALPLMAAGSLAARWTTQICVPPAGGETGNETGEHLHRVSSTGSWPLVVGLLAALIVVGLLTQTAAVARRKSLGRVPTSAFFWLPPLAFVGQEFAERMFGSEVGGGAPGWHLALGLALQLPFGLLAYTGARLLARVAERLGQHLAGRSLAPVRARAADRVRRRRVELPRIAALASGYGERGPPLLA